MVACIAQGNSDGIAARTRLNVAGDIHFIRREAVGQICLAVARVEVIRAAGRGHIYLRLGDGELFGREQSRVVGSGLHIGDYPVSAGVYGHRRGKPGEIRRLVCAFNGVVIYHHAVKGLRMGSVLRLVIFTVDPSRYGELDPPAVGRVSDAPRYVERAFVFGRLPLIVIIGKRELYAVSAHSRRRHGNYAAVNRNVVVVAPFVAYLHYGSVEFERVGLYSAVEIKPLIFPVNGYRLLFDREGIYRDKVAEVFAVAVAVVAGGLYGDARVVSARVGLLCVKFAFERLFAVFIKEVFHRYGAVFAFALFYHISIVVFKPGRGRRAGSKDILFGIEYPRVIIVILVGPGKLLPPFEFGLLHRIGLFGRRFGEHIVAVQFVFGIERGGERVLFAAVHVFELIGAGRNKAYLRPAVILRGVNGRHVAALVGAVVSEYLFRPLRRNLGRIYGDFERALVNFVVGSRYLKVHGVAFNAAIRAALYVAEHNGTVAYGVIVDVVEAESPFGRVAKLPVWYSCGGHFHSACRRVLYAVVCCALFAAVDFVTNIAIGYFGGRYHIRALERSFCELNGIVGIFPLGGNIVSPCILRGAAGDKNSYIKIIFAVHFALGYAVVAILYAIVRSNDDAVVGIAALYYFHGDLRGGYDEFIRHIGGERIVAAEIVIRIELCGEYVAASVGEISVGSYCKFVLAAVDALIPCRYMAEQRCAAIHQLFRLSAPVDSNLFGLHRNGELTRIIDVVIGSYAEVDDVAFDCAVCAALYIGKIGASAVAALFKTEHPSNVVAFRIYNGCRSVGDLVKVIATVIYVFERIFVDRYPRNTGGGDRKV